MATTPANLLQTSFNVAATIVAAELAVGGIETASTLDRLLEIKGQVYSELIAADNAEAPRTSGGGSTPVTGRSGGGKVFTYDEAANVTFNYGSFKGCTLGAVAKMTEDQTAEYGYERPGSAYIKWLSEQTDPKRGFLKRAASAYIEGARASSN